MTRLTMRGWRATLAGACVIALGAGLAAQKQQINGAGATFPNPIYQKWFSEYNKLHPNIEINYQSIGSGGGIRQITNQTVFFGASDGPMTNDQLIAAPGKLLHFPTVLGAVVPTYNLPGVTAQLKFTGPLLADIFLGKIT
ncbi:MAG TPA: phosphate ABC transporter substrate-binding protein PstS, partial [Vicinamibacterales bacterium]|nr:phosphate ABC transporter substrate-binding protein PstS [Vicinamibacterales bacterium]